VSSVPSGGLASMWLASMTAVQPAAGALG